MLTKGAISLSRGICDGREQPIAVSQPLASEFHSSALGSERRKIYSTRRPSLDRLQLRSKRAKQSALETNIYPLRSQTRTPQRPLLAV